VGPIPAADCSSFIVGRESVMPYCSSDMLMRFTAWRIYLSWWRTWSFSSSTRGLFFEGAQCIAWTQTHPVSYVRCLWFESQSWVRQSQASCCLYKPPSRMWKSAVIQPPTLPLSILSNSLATVQGTIKFSGFHWTLHWNGRRLSYYTW
jgi:hypothetical protein